MKYPAELILQFVKDYESGLSVMAIAVKNGLTHKIVRRALNGKVKMRKQTTAITEKNKNIQKAFMSHVKITADCWEWQLSKNNKGYGQYSIKGKSWLTHRFSYTIFIGDCTNRFVCHKCDNPKCCSPFHLFLGDYLINLMDAVNKGRRKRKLSEADVIEIKELIKTGIGNDTIAKKYGVNRTTIRGIRRGKYWNWLK